MTNERPEASLVNEGMVILIAIIAVIFTVLLLILFFQKATFFEVLIGSFTVFGVVYIITRYVFYNRYSKIFRKFMEKPVEIKWLLLVTFTAIAIIPLVLISIRNYYTKGIEGKVKCIFPDGKVKIFDVVDTKSVELECIFPQVAEVPFCSTRTYATSGKIKSKFNNETLDGRECYTEITFQNFRNSTDCNSGWMICPLMGYDAYKFTHLSFWVRGAKGEEKFGIKIKDTRGIEVNVEIMEYLENEKVSTSWQRVIIPLEHFLNVDMSTLSIISLYSDGKLSYKDSETIYVTDFKLY